MAAKRLKPVHPGDILAHDFMEPLELSSYKLAKELSASVPTVMSRSKRFKRSIAASPEPSSAPH